MRGLERWTSTCCTCSQTAGYDAAALLQVCGRHAGMGRLRGAQPTAAPVLNSPAANKTRMAYTVASVREDARTRGQPPPGFCVLATSRINIVISKLAKASQPPPAPAVTAGTSAWCAAVAAAREQHDQRYASTQPDRTLYREVHMAPPFVFLGSFCVTIESFCEPAVVSKRAS
jgi:hypothetical protein